MGERLTGHRTAHASARLLRFASSMAGKGKRCLSVWVAGAWLPGVVWFLERHCK